MRGTVVVSSLDDFNFTEAMDELIRAFTDLAEVLIAEHEQHNVDMARAGSFRGDYLVDFYPDKTDRVEDVEMARAGRR